MFHYLVIKAQDNTRTVTEPPKCHYNNEVSSLQVHNLIEMMTRKKVILLLLQTLFLISWTSFGLVFNGTNRLGTAEVAVLCPSSLVHCNIKNSCRVRTAAMATDTQSSKVTSQLIMHHTVQRTEPMIASFLSFLNCFLLH